MNYRIRTANWATQIADAVKDCNPGDTITVPSDAAKELGQRALSRIRPDKQIIFVVETEWGGDLPA